MYKLVKRITTNLNKDEKVLLYSSTVSCELFFCDVKQICG